MSKLPLIKRLNQRLSSYYSDGVASTDHAGLVSELTDQLHSYLDDESIDDIYEAYLYGAEAHKGQKRQSGEDYIYHPLAVAKILGDLRMDSRTIIAAILHDVVEDTDITLAQLADQFGGDVAVLVDGVSKVSQLEQESKEHAEAASFHKMLMAMAKDIRVIIIKLSDRLHNMNTLSSLKKEKRRRISKQTLEIYAPIANRLGIREFAQNLEDLSFEVLYPKRFRAIKESVEANRQGKESIIEDVCSLLRSKFTHFGLGAEIQGRNKSIYSIYRKMQRKKLSLKDVPDIRAIRIIVESRHHCYQALGILHQIYKPRPSAFKDYIALPKVNGYQSLHTIVVGPFGQPVEIQIRSQSMHRTAEMGVASHWFYKTETTGEHAPQQLAQQWLTSFLEAQEQSSTSGEFLEHLKADLFPDEVFVFTPKGDIKRLPRGSTALDFAYSVHSDIGDHCIGARIDQITVPLHEQLSNGDHVEIITSNSARPTPSWLNYAVTSKARAKIRYYLNQQKTKESISLGRRLLRQALGKLGYRRIRIPTGDKNTLLKQLQVSEWDELLGDIGFGKRLAALVAKQLLAVTTLPEMGGSHSEEHKSTALTIEGTERLLVTYANCCHPIPGDEIIGTTTKERGIVIHRARCNNCKNLLKHPDNYFHLNWSDSVAGKFQVLLKLDTLNQPGVLAKISNIIAEYGSNINNLSVDSKHNHTSTMSFIIEVTDRVNLANIMRRLHGEEVVVKLSRG